jgi:hypothetical protein
VQDNRFRSGAGANVWHEIRLLRAAQPMPARKGYRPGTSSTGHVSSGSIDQVLERLSSLELVTSRDVSGHGRRTILWSAVDHQYEELMEEETAEPKESPQGT